MTVLAQRRPIGLWRSWSMVAGMMIGSGIFTLPSLLAAYGSFSFLGWALSGFGALCLALTYANFAARQAGLGGPYFYVRMVFGKRWGALVAWSYWFSLVSAVSAIALSFVGYCANYLPFEQDNLTSTLLAVCVVLAFAAINMVGVRGASILQLVATICKILPLLIIGILGIWLGDIQHIPAIKPGESSTLGMLASMCLLIMWAFIGVESATVPSEDTINPEKTIPRASILGTLTATTVYVIATWGIMSVLSLDALKISSSPFSDAAQLLLGNAGETLVTLGALFAIGGTLNVCVMMSGTMMLAGARDNVFPALLARQNSHGTATNALLFSSAISIGLLLLNISESLLKGFEILLTLSTFAVLVVYLLTALASMAMQWRERHKHRRKFKLDMWIATLACCFSTLAIIGAWVLYH